MVPRMKFVSLVGCRYTGVECTFRMFLYFLFSSFSYNIALDTPRRPFALVSELALKGLFLSNSKAFSKRPPDP